MPLLVEEQNYTLSIKHFQIALYNKVRVGYELCKKYPIKVYPMSFFDKLTKEEQFQALAYDTIAESYRMLVANYLIALIGYKKNDTSSLYHHPVQGKEEKIYKFVEENRLLVDKIYKIRNKVYAHYDVKFKASSDDLIQYEELEKIINFIAEVLKR